MSNDAISLEKEFAFTDSDFIYLSQLIKARAGIDLPDTKRELVYGRLSKRLRQLGLKSFKQYCNILENGDKEEFTNFINAITTNVTSFFRENHHFEFLKTVLFPKIVESQTGNLKPKLRIWSAGCSSGKEPYSIAMVLRECIPDINAWDAKILATDLDSHILDVARKGVYPSELVKDVSEERRKRWIQDGHGSNDGEVKVRDELKELISFRQLNLMDAWPMQGQFDIIFCRNVTIYFDKDTRSRIIDRFANQLIMGGHFFIGHSESLFGLTERFAPAGRTIHTKIS